MKLTVFVGSPRGEKSNTNYLLKHFLRGFEATSGNSYELFYLNHLKDTDRFVLTFAAAERMKSVGPVPLYTDAMPGSWSKDSSRSWSRCAAGQGNPNLGFVVQSGFGDGSEHSQIRGQVSRKAGVLVWGVLTWERSSSRTVNQSAGIHEDVQKCL